MEEEAVWKTSYCLNEQGFPILLYGAMMRLGIMERPEYVGREFEEYGTERCEVIVHVGKSRDYPEKEAWKVSTTGFRFMDTYQSVARKALRMLCQMYEKEVARTPMRFFPPMVKTRPVWLARMRTLEGRGQREDDPTVVFMSAYLLALDNHYDKQASKSRKNIRRAEEAETMVRRLQVQLAEARARAAEAEKHEAEAVEALKEAKDLHTQQLKDAYLVTRNKRRALMLEAREDPHQKDALPPQPESGKRKAPEAPPAPPPTEASHGSMEASPGSTSSSEEEVLPLTQPPPEMENECPLLIPMLEAQLAEE